MQKFIFATLLALSSIASAQSSQSCLQQASNKELINELSTRLGAGGGPTGNAILTTTCSNSYLYLRTFNSATGAKSEKASYVGSACFNLEASLKNVTNVGISRTLIVSVCENDYLSKIAVSTSGTMTQISNDYLGAVCNQTAIDANNNLRP